MIETQGGANIDGDVTAGTFIGRDKVTNINIFNGGSSEQLRNLLGEQGVFSEQIAQAVIAAIENGTIDNLQSNLNITTDKPVEIVNEQTFISTVPKLDMKSLIIHSMNAMPMYNQISDDLFSFLEFFEFPLLHKYWLIQLVDKDRLHNSIISLFAGFLDSIVINRSMETILLSSINIIKLNEDLNCLRHANMIAKLPSAELKIKVEAAIKRSINDDQLLTDITDMTIANIPPKNEVEEQIVELIKNAVIDAAKKLDEPTKI